MPTRLRHAGCRAQRTARQRSAQQSTGCIASGVSETPQRTAIADHARRDDRRGAAGCARSQDTVRTNRGRRLRPAWQRSALLRGAEVARHRRPDCLARQRRRGGGPAATTVAPPCPTCPGARGGPGGRLRISGGQRGPAGRAVTTAPGTGRGGGPSSSIEPRACRRCLDCRGRARASLRRARLRSSPAWSGRTSRARAKPLVPPDSRGTAALRQLAVRSTGTLVRIVPSARRPRTGARRTESDRIRYWRCALRKCPARILLNGKEGDGGAHAAARHDAD